MRFAIAITVLVLSGIAFILGIGQRTVFAPPAAVTFGTVEGVAAEYAVIPAEVFRSVEGDPHIVVAAEGAFAAVGSQVDVDAWAAAFDHAQVAAESASKALVFQEVPGDPLVLQAPEEEPADGEEPAEDAEAADGEESQAMGEREPADPRGSDLWVVEQSATAGELRMSVDLDDDEAVLVATTGGLGEGVSVLWTQDRSTPFAGPLLVTGGILAVLGAILYLLAVDHNRRGLGPRRGRRGPLLGLRGSGSRRRDARGMKRVALPALVLAGALGLSGCSASYWPDFSPKPEETVVDLSQESTVAPVPINHVQIDRIVGDIATVAGEADAELDIGLLKSRFTGDALTQRASSYTIQAALPDYERVPHGITNEQLGYELVQSTDGWPRTMFITVSSEAEVPDEAADAEATPEEGAEDETAPPVDAEEAQHSLALIMTQAGPHENYLVSRVITLRGGIAMPEAAPAEEGTALLAPDLQTLVVPPGEVGEAFAAVLQGGTEVEQAQLFDLDDLADHRLLTESGFTWVQQAQERAAADGYTIQYSVTARVGEEPLTALSTGVGGGLVAVTVIEERVSDTAGSTTRLRAEGAIAALSGLSGQQERIVSEVAHQLLFFVPSKVSGDKIHLLGATSEWVGARN